MKDLSRLRIRHRIVILGLISREPPQHAWREPGSNASISKAVIRPSRPKVVEYHGMPAYGYRPCGVCVMSMWRSDIERHRVSLNRSFAVWTVVAVAGELTHVAMHRSSPRIRAGAAAGRGVPHPRRGRSIGILGWKLETVGRRARRELVGRRIKAQDGLATPLVETQIAQNCRRWMDPAAAERASTLSPKAAHLEQVGEVAVEQHGAMQIDRRSP